MKTAARIAVIIPFYQSEPGILARALDSIRAQVLPPVSYTHLRAHET